MTAARVSNGSELVNGLDQTSQSIFFSLPIEREITKKPAPIGNFVVKKEHDLHTNRRTKPLNARHLRSVVELNSGQSQTNPAANGL